MQTFIKDGKYQVLEILSESEGFRSCLCIDVETDNQYRQMILNTYESAQVIRRFIPAFYAMRSGNCGDFIDAVSGPHSITAVFTYHEGVHFSEFFERLDRDDFELRLDYASLLLETTLIFDIMEGFIVGAVFNSDHIVVLEKAKKVAVNYIIPPGRSETDGFKRRQTAALFRMIFKKNRFYPDAVFEYIRSLEEDKRNLSMVEILAEWKKIESGLLEEHEKLKKESIFAYLIRRIKQKFSQKVKNKLPH